MRTAMPSIYCEVYLQFGSKFCCCRVDSYDLGGGG